MSELAGPACPGLFTGAAVKIRAGRPVLSHEGAESNANYRKSQRFGGACKPQVVSVVDEFRAKTHHGDTENTEVPQRTHM
jgi:hypothetical protein